MLLSIQSKILTEISDRKKIHWKDGRIWNITRVLLMFKTNVNNQPVLQYNVLIHGQQKQLYKEKDKWFVIPKD